MPAEYTVLETTRNRHGDSEWCHVRHLEDGHEAIYCLRCRKVSPYEGTWPHECPECHCAYAAKAVPETPTPPRKHGIGNEPINPQTGVGEYSGESYKMVYDWDRGYVWQVDMGMK